ncbi:hypothetical protein DENIS_0694 [Desulfonema ishimotonii]|uniref:Uncharacterized protein n=1 Tax=Desulfonema ishimotonii TaxID=45657 RepID=A0A401FS26_9BACT|nr:hypothetical protein [Desulfonema ishimotonii]GBC59753.1 hypothetical protein DENIS_0694 [Desulfonema ishimotonii]
MCSRFPPAYITISLMASVPGARCAFFLQGLAAAISGVIGTVLMVFIFDHALILMTSLAGTSMIVQSVSMPPRFVSWLFICLMAFGIAVQVNMMTFESASKKGERRRG